MTASRILSKHASVPVAPVGRKSASAMRIGSICLAISVSMALSPFDVPMFQIALGQDSNAPKKPGKKTAKPGTPRKKPKKKPQPFRWVNRLKNSPIRQLQHNTFTSPSMKQTVGYCIYLPDQYEAAPKARFPVVYYLHGGRPGNELKSISLAPLIHANIQTGKAPPMIYVFVNGGPVSHYNVDHVADGHGADVFINELIPHIDKTYRTIAKQSGRALEGFSQGGRGTARLMFRYPHLFCSAAAGGGGHATERRISENDGWENDKLRFRKGDNTWDLARKFAQAPNAKLNVLIYVGNKGFNYENNLEYMKHLESLKIPHSKLIVPDAPHSAKIIYQKRSREIMAFHARNFGLTPNGE